MNHLFPTTYLPVMTQVNTSISPIYVRIMNYCRYRYTYVYCPMLVSTLEVGVSVVGLWSSVDRIFSIDLVTCELIVVNFIIMQSHYLLLHYRLILCKQDYQ